MWSYVIVWERARSPVNGCPIPTQSPYEASLRRQELRGRGRRRPSAADQAESVTTHIETANSYSKDDDTFGDGTDNYNAAVVVAAVFIVTIPKGY